MTKSESSKTPAAKPQSSSIHSANPTIMPPSDLGKAPPVPEGAPMVAKGEARSLKHLNLPQVALLGALATDFGASKTWEADFGAYAPAQATMVQMAQGVAAVFAESVNALSWETYVWALRLLCGDSFATQMESLVAVYQLALKQNPGMANTYPSLAAYVNAKSEANAKIQAGKKKAKKAKEDAATPAAASPAVAPTPAPASAPVAAVGGTHQ